MKIIHRPSVSLALALTLPVLAGCATSSEPASSHQPADQVAVEPSVETELRYQQRQTLTGTRLRLAEPEGRWRQPLLSYLLVTHDDQDLQYAGEHELDRALELINVTVLGIPTRSPFGIR